MAKAKTDEGVLFTKKQLLQSKKYIDKRDLLTALLKDGKGYSQEETDNIIEVFLKGEAK